MRIVITGALGHIGSRLIHSLQPGEWEEVVLLDNLSRQRYCSLDGLPDGVSFRFIEGDVCSADLDAICGGAAVVIHLAAVTNADATPGDESGIESENFAGAERVAAMCARRGCRLFVPSTTSIYGAGGGPNPYAETKLRIESMLRAAGESGGLRYCVARFGTIYGRSVGMRFDTAVNKFCWQASLGQPLTVWRTAMDQVRPYLDVGDAARAIRFVVDRDLFDGRVWDVTSHNTTVRAVIDLVREVVPDLVVDSVDSPIMNDLSFSVSAEPFCREGFAFHGDLRRGIHETLEHLGHLRRRPTPHGQP